MQRSAGINDVFEDDHMPAFERRFQPKGRNNLNL
jgi:hypothetical protein